MTSLISSSWTSPTIEKPHTDIIQLVLNLVNHSFAGYFTFELICSTSRVDLAVLEFKVDHRQSNLRLPFFGGVGDSGDVHRRSDGPANRKMFKSVRWRSEKNKINAVFKLSFHATQVLQFGGSSLVLSLIPADTGKPTAKLEKHEIRDDCCYWESPVFETVKLVQDPKNGKIHDRIYYFIISTGSSKSSIVGEASVNFSEYAEATKAASIALPFKSLNSDVVLHVSIQRMQENVNQREQDEHKVVTIKPEDRSLKGHFAKCNSEENTNTYYNQEKPLTNTVPNTVEFNGNGRGSIGSDITLSSSEHSSGFDTPQELGLKSNDILLDAEKAPIAHNQQGTGWEWSLTAALDSSTDDSTNSQRDALDGSVEKLKSDLILLSRKADIADLELQTLRKQIVKENKKGQDLLKEVALLKEERDAFKEECERLKASQKAGNKTNYEGNPWDLLEETRQELNHERNLNTNLRLQLHMTQESNSELILAVRDLEQHSGQANRGDLDASIKPVTNNVFEKLEGRVLEQQGQISDDDDEQKALEELVKQHSDAKEAYILEQKIIDLCSEIEMYRRDKDEVEMQMEQLALDYEILKQENHDMSYKLEQSHLQQQLKLQYECSGSYATINELEIQVEMLEREVSDRSYELQDSLSIIKDLENHNQSLGDELDKQAHQFKAELEALDSAKMEKEQQAIQAEEALRSVRHELENRIERLESELQKQSKEFSDAMSTIKELEDQIQSLEEELDKHAQVFESDLEAVTHAKVEQEQRAIRAEEALRMTRWKNVNTAERIQDEFKRLSTQMHSTFEANEKVASKAMTESSHLRLLNKHLEDLLQQSRDELQSVKESHEAQLSDLRKQLSMKLVEIEAQRESNDEACRSLSAELLMVRAEVDRLTSDTDSLREQIEHRERYNVKSVVVESTKKKAVESLNTLKTLEAEVGNLRAQSEEMRHSISEDELEKEKLRKQVFQLIAEIKKKDGALAKMERRLKDRTNVSSKMSKTESASHTSKDSASLKERVKLLEGQIKLKEVAMETTTNAFLEKEKDLYNKIEELETDLKELSQTSIVHHEDDRLKVNGYTEDSHNLNGNDTDAAINRNGEGACTINSVDEHGIDALLKEMTSLREEKSFMEAELKEMQERYSDISLKFAEVEGERQRLVMTLRNVKNTKK
ncbi:hypothetical protein V2J09_022458 [Rumex salicifolius]